MRAMGDRSTIEWTEATWNPVTGGSNVLDRASRSLLS
jgi:protein gp37